MTLTEQIITIGIAVLGVQFTRWLPFWIFPANRPIPEYIRYLGRVLPAAMFGMLVVYCYKNIDVLSGFHGLPEFIAETRKYYPTDDVLKADIVKAYQTVIQELYAAGCRNLQLDDCTWTLYADRAFWKIFNITEESLRLIAEEEIAINNAAIANHPEDMVITTHVCRGNFHSTYASEGAYDPIAPYLFAKENVDAFYLEYDDARSGGFEPLKYIPEGKKVVLGLITTKSAELEDKNRIIRRIHDAARYVPLENLYLSPQCGFASTEEGNKLTEDEQWAKLALVKEIAESVWGD